MARKNRTPVLDTYLRSSTKELEEVLVGLGEATERFILSHSRIPHKTKSQDRERNFGCRSFRAAKEGRSVGGTVVGRFRITTLKWSISQHIYRRRVGTKWEYEVQLQYCWNGNIPMEQLCERILARDKFTEHP